MIFIYIFSFFKVYKTLFIKNEIDDKQINQIKKRNYFYKGIIEKIKKLKKDLNLMKNLNLEYSKLISKTLLRKRKLFKLTLLNEVNRVYSKNKVVNINEVESSIK